MNVLMPQLGETVTEGTISRWYKNAGDAVESGDILFEIETDKTAMDVPAVASGVLSEVRAEAGKTVPVGSIVAIITEAGEKAPEKAPDPPAAEGAVARPSGSGADVPVDPYSGVRSPAKNYGAATLKSGKKITPLARRLAAQSGIDPEQVSGSGPHGRIVARDIRRTEPQAATKSVPADRSVAPVTAVDAGQVVPLDGMRRTIAQRLVESKAGVPHFYLKAEVRVDALLALRKEINAVAGRKVSVNDLVVKAYAQALQRVPEANRIWAEDKIIQFRHSDVGVAVSMPGGLVTPIVRRADQKSISELAAEIADLAERGKSRRLRPEEYQGGVATVSNLGMFGISEFSAIINPPQSTILAVGAAERRVEEGVDGAARFATRMTVTLSVDHRVLDGATGAALLSAFRDLAEKPVALLI